MIIIIPLTKLAPNNGASNDVELTGDATGASNLKDKTQTPKGSIAALVKDFLAVSQQFHDRVSELSPQELDMCWVQGMERFVETTPQSTDSSSSTDPYNNKILPDDHDSQPGKETLTEQKDKGKQWAEVSSPRQQEIPGLTNVVEQAGGIAGEEAESPQAPPRLCKRPTSAERMPPPPVPQRERGRSKVSTFNVKISNRGREHPCSTAPSRVAPSFVATSAHAPIDVGDQTRNNNISIQPSLYGTREFEQWSRNAKNQTDSRAYRRSRSPTRRRLAGSHYELGAVSPTVATFSLKEDVHQQNTPAAGPSRASAFDEDIIVQDSEEAEVQNSQLMACGAESANLNGKKRNAKRKRADGDTDVSPRPSKSRQGGRKSAKST